MMGVELMSTREANIALLSMIPEDDQLQIFLYLTQNFCNGNPIEPKSAEDIFRDLEISRACYERGEYEDIDAALSEIGNKYGL